MERRHNTRLAAAKDAAEVKSNSDQDETDTGSTAFPGRSAMYEAFQTWALKTYGDSAKTKTVTRRKYNRITKILKGEEQTSAENSKFRFWVKAKGFRIGPSRDDVKKDNHLYVPCSRIAPGGNGKEETVFKKVAMVENFFDIIYGVHVEMDGRGGKHAGQKRTYKAIAETYAFLPREAVTHFLMSCADCQKRMHLAGEGVKGRHNNGDEEEESTPPPEGLTDPPDIDYSLPITTTYLKHMRRLGYSEEYALNPDKEDTSSNADSEVSEGAATSQEGTCHSAECQTDDVGDDFVGPYDVDCGRTTDCDGPLDMTSVAQENGHWSGGDAEPINMTREVKLTTGGSHQDHAYDRILSPFSGAASREAPATPDNLSAGTKDDDDEDDDEDGDKIDPNHCDPERLKAFNMFVRLFVDENLDRMVPISKQPKEKIQAIIDSCARQFPEFSDRARKRIRTYLKSCRRNKRTRDQCNWEGGRPTLPHLTSAQAEHILAGACENESQNAKRMRLGLKPISVSLDEVDRQRQVTTPAAVPSAAADSSPSSRVEIKGPRTPSMALSICPVVNGGSHYRTVAYPSFPAAAALASATCTNGPTDLSIKKERPAKYSLNPNETVAVKQLIAGYRESAAFLLRSADELEQLLLQQN